ncbi:MAG: quinol:electron acceptor oxidoreductase subunit ActD [Acidobacteriota bacterium]
MSERIIAVLDGVDQALSAVESLRRQGFSRAAITIMSAEPIHGAPFESDQTKSRIAGFAIAGGVIGAIAAVLLTVVTSRRVDLVTGGMPIVTPWAFGIIIFELAALGAILATLGRMIFEARLARRSALADYDEAVADGSVVLAVECSDEACLEAAKNVLGANLTRTS